MKRLETVIVKLTREEKLLLKEKAEKEGLTMAGYIRFKLLRR